MKTKQIKRCLFIVFAFILFISTISYLIGYAIVDASSNLVTNQQTMDAYQESWKLEKFAFQQFKNKYDIKHHTMPSSFQSHTLPFDIITKKQNQNIVIMSHGMLGNRLTNYPTAEIFLERGYNVITYDQRCS